MDLQGYPVQLPYLGQPYDIRNTGSAIVYYGDRNVSNTNNVGSIAPGTVVTVSQAYYVVCVGRPGEIQFNPATGTVAGITKAAVVATGLAPVDIGGVASTAIDVPSGV